MRTKAVIAAHLQAGQRVFIDSRFYLIDKVARNGHYIDLEVQGAFYPVCLPINQIVKVRQ